MRGKLADVVALDDARFVQAEANARARVTGEQTAPRCTCGCDGVLVKHNVCAWPECTEHATHVRPMCGGPGARCDVPLCEEHFGAIDRDVHADVSMSATTARDDEPTAPGMPAPKVEGKS